MPNPPVDLTTCFILLRAEKTQQTVTPATPLGTAKDLMLGAPQKVDMQCFLSLSDGEKTYPMKTPIVIEMPKPDQLKLFRIRF